MSSTPKGAHCDVLFTFHTHIFSKDILDLLHVHTIAENLINLLTKSKSALLNLSCINRVYRQEVLPFVVQRAYFRSSNLIFNTSTNLVN